jgi:hypothetical protein
MLFAILAIWTCHDMYMPTNLLRDLKMLLSFYVWMLCCFDFVFEYYVMLLDFYFLLSLVCFDLYNLLCNLLTNMAVGVWWPKKKLPPFETFLIRVYNWKKRLENLIYNLFAFHVLLNINLLLKPKIHVFFLKNIFFFASSKQFFF